MSWTPSRVALAAITAGVVAAGVGAGMLLQPTTDRAEPKARGPNVSIAVVNPREPVPEPGGVMDVGDLADGYMHSGPAPSAPAYPRLREAPGDEPSARVEPRRAERPAEVSPRPAPAPVVVERRERPSRWPFGLDQPGRDYAAERRERRARMDEQLRFEEARRAERFDDRPPWAEPRDARGRDDYPARDRGGRERQWYRDDGRPVAGPDERY